MNRPCLPSQGRLSFACLLVGGVLPLAGRFHAISAKSRI